MIPASEQMQKRQLESGCRSDFACCFWLRYMIFHVCLFNTNGLCSFQFYRPKKQMFALRDGLSQIQEIEDCISTSALNYKSIILKT